MMNNDELYCPDYFRCPVFFHYWDSGNRSFWIREQPGVAVRVIVEEADLGGEGGMGKTGECDFDMAGILGDRRMVAG